MPRAIPARAALIIVALASVPLLAGCGASKQTTTAATAPKAAATAAATTSTTPKPGGPAVIATTLNEFKITPAVTTATAGRVILKIRNTGKIRHQLTVIRTTKPASTVLAHGKSDDVPGRAGEIKTLAAGGSTTLRMRLKPGHYALVCNLTGHYKAGMFADFTVTA